MAEVVEEPGLVEQARVEEQPVELLLEEQPAGGFLQPLVPAPGQLRRPRGPRTGRLVVDEVLQVSAKEIKIPCRTAGGGACGASTRRAGPGLQGVAEASLPGAWGRCWAPRPESC